MLKENFVSVLRRQDRSEFDLNYSTTESHKLQPKQLKELLSRAKRKEAEQRKWAEHPYGLWHLFTPTTINQKASFPGFFARTQLNRECARVSCTFLPLLPCESGLFHFVRKVPTVSDIQIGNFKYIQRSTKKLLQLNFVRFF